MNDNKLLITAIAITFGLLTATMFVVMWISIYQIITATPQEEAYDICLRLVINGDESLEECNQFRGE